MIRILNCSRRKYTVNNNRIAGKKIHWIYRKPVHRNSNNNSLHNNIKVNIYIVLYI